MIVRALKGLAPIISISVVDYLLGKEGWKFSTNEGCTPDKINNAQFLSEIYYKADKNYTGNYKNKLLARFTVPVLWDKKLNTIGILKLINS